MRCDDGAWYLGYVVLLKSETKLCVASNSALCDGWLLNDEVHNFIFVTTVTF